MNKATEQATYEIFVEQNVQYPKTIPLPLRSLRETRDVGKVVELLQSGNWIVYGAYHCSDGKELFCLGELTICQGT